ncbi:hypothetical protein KJ596_00955 [Patescibacteria group bacterium]|nr:hypothetical protein [Patescibacteria group bacterium]MBU1868805.1 hypothetical protein [Patescibacteria group bacterium]
MKTNSKYKITDQRKSLNSKQIQLLRKQLEKEKIYSKLQRIEAFLGKYSLALLCKLEIKVVDGKVGEGEVKDGVVLIQLPPTTKAIHQIKQSLRLYTGKLSDTKCEEIFWALTVSTILHEGVHMLLNSRPGSKLTNDFEKNSGIKNVEGKISTLLDEGFAYAIQGIYSKTIEPIGSLEPRPNKPDSKIVKIRKELGMYLNPKVKIYFQDNKEIDSNLLLFAAEQIKELEAAITKS